MVRLVTTHPRSESTGFLWDLFSESGAELLRLYESAVENSGLLSVDFYTIRDLLELSGYGGDESVSALLLCLMLALDDGSLCVQASESGLARRLVDLVGEEDARTWAGRILAGLRNPGFPALIGERVEDGKPIVWRRCGEQVYLYFQKYLKHDLILKEELRKRLRPWGPVAPLEVLRAAWQEVLVDRPLQIDGRPLQLNRDQRLAVALALLQNFVIISGGPGTGKTAIVVTLLRCLVRCGLTPERIAVAAPTGRAAQRLTDAIRGGLNNLPGRPDSPDTALAGMTAQTLHHLLRYHPARGSFRHHAENPLPADIVIVDEVSMVGLVAMASLFQALNPDTRVVLLGDKDQLPSVEAGAVLANLVPTDQRLSYSADLATGIAALEPGLELPPSAVSQRLQDVVVILRENYRSQQHIQEVARAVNEQRAELVEQLPSLLAREGESESVGEWKSETAPLSPCSTLSLSHSVLLTDLEQQSGCRLLELPNSSVAAWRRLLEHWAEHHYLSPVAGAESYSSLVGRCRALNPEALTEEQKGILDRLFMVFGRARILTLVREGPWGCAGVNRFLQQILRSRLGWRGRGAWFPGAPVLVTRNDYVRRLFNGDVGITLATADGGFTAVFQRQDGYLSVAADSLPAHELAFALTVHKSQGSEYGQVLLVLPPEGGRRLLTKEMVYTGVTRAKHLAIICAPREVLRSAIARRIERESAW